MNSIESGMMKALVYADLFDFPLTTIEMWHWFVGRKPCQETMIRMTADQLVHRGVIDTDSGYYFLPGRLGLVRLRKRRLGWSTQKYLRAQKLAHNLSRIPWIMGVFLTGTVAVDNARLEDDIDLMIVTRTQRLWSSRLIVTGWLDLLGVRRKPHQEESRDYYCVNLYLDEASLTVPTRLHNLYTAHEVLLAKVLYDRGGIADRFLQDNRWVKTHLPNTLIALGRKGMQPPPRQRWFERFSYGLQRAYMQSKMTIEVVTRKQAYFHPKDMAKLVLPRYEQALRRYGIK